MLDREDALWGECGQRRVYPLCGRLGFGWRAVGTSELKLEDRSVDVADDRDRVELSIEEMPGVESQPEGLRLIESPKEFDHDLRLVEYRASAWGEGLDEDPPTQLPAASCRAVERIEGPIECVIRDRATVRRNRQDLSRAEAIGVLDRVFDVVDGSTWGRSEDRP